MNKIIKNYAYNLSYQILVMILPILTTPYISRALNPEGVGKYNYAYSIISVVLIFAQMGTNLYGQREIAFVQNQPKQRSAVFWEVWIFRVISTALITPVYLLITSQMYQYRNILLWMSLYLLANVFDVSWYFQGLEEFKKTAFRSIAVKILGAILIFIFVNKPEDLIVYTIILALSQLFGNIILCLYIPKSVSVAPRNRISLKKHIKPIIELFLPTAAVYVYTYVDKIFLGIFSSDYELGIYSQPERIIKLLMTIITSLGIVLLPNVSVELKDGKLDFIKEKLDIALKFIIYVGVPMVLGCIVISNRFIPLFLGEEYADSILIFKVLSPLIIIIGTASIVGQAILIPFKKQKEYTISIFSGAAINVIINMMLIPKFGALGAAIGTIVAETTVTFIQSIATERILSVNIVRSMIQCKKSIFSSVLMFAAIVLADKKMPSGVAPLFCIIFIGVITYVVCLFTTKDRFLFNILGKD